MPKTVRLRSCCLTALVLSLLGFVGCAPAPEISASMPRETISASALCEKLDAVLESTYHRRLNLRDHAAWQILHGALAFKQDFQVEREPDGERVSAVEHLLAGGSLNGWTTEPGTLDERTGRRGLRAILEAGTKTGQGHPDQWLAVLAQCDLEPDQAIVTVDGTYTMADYVAQVQVDVPRNVSQEYSWTLIGLTAYLPTSSNWVAADGRPWSIERLVEIELQHELATSACGGSHRLIGLAMALNRHLDQGGELTGVWFEADQRIQRAIEDARRFQNPDGSFSTNYFARPGNSPDLAQNLGTTGHTLEFLTLAMTDERLVEPWMKQAVLHLCDLFHSTQDVALECGKLYHAAHALVLYRERVFGKRRHGQTQLNRPAATSSWRPAAARKSPGNSLSAHSIRAAF